MVTPFPFQHKITLDIQNNLTVNEIRASFGDGYEQVSGKGVKPVLDSLSITIAPLTKVEMLSFESFCKAVGTWGVISLVPPFETITLLYKIKGTVKKYQIGKEKWKFSLTLLEV